VIDYFWLIMFSVSVQNYCQHSNKGVTILYLWQVSMVTFQCFGSLPLSSYVIFVVTTVTADTLLPLYNSQWNNTVPKDLFDALEQQRIEDNINVPPVQVFFEPWTTQSGYPIINVTRTNWIITVTQVSRSIYNHYRKPIKLRLLVQYTEQDLCIQHGLCK